MNNTIQKKSSKIVSDFLEKNNLHKKEFAQMIGVTLSYVYNLIDENVPFSTRSTTLERIATVMDINPEDFIEYQIPSEVKSFSENLLTLKDLIKENNMSVLEFLKMFENKKRLEIVDILRGAKPFWIDFYELKKVGYALKIKEEDIFLMWEKRLTEYLKEGGFSLEKNRELLDSMLKKAKEKIMQDN